MKTNYSKEVEMQEVINLLKQKPEIDEKIGYYKEVLKSQDNLIKGIDARLKKGSVTTVSWVLGFIPVFNNSKLDACERARLEIEALDASTELFAKQNYFEQWLKRSKDYEIKFDEITRECNENFNEVVEKAEVVVKRGGNLRLVQTMSHHEEAKKRDNYTQKMKNEYYLYLIQEIENHRLHSKK